MILIIATENRYGNRIEAGEQVSIISSNGEEVYIMPLKSRLNSNPIGVWVKKSEVQV